MIKYRKVRITEEIWTGKEWKQIKQTTRNEPILSLNERMYDFKTHD